MNDLPFLSIVASLTFFYILLAWYFLDSLRLIVWAAIYSFGLLMLWSEFRPIRREEEEREASPPRSQSEL